ncbi:MAG: TIGR04168 family protein, partial [Cyanobacteria bacterium J06559_3]
MDTSVQDKVLRIAIIGDVHDQWDEQDAVMLRSLQVDLVLLVGDFGNEAVEVVRSIARLDIPKAAIFGNHDAWYSATPWGRRKCPYDRTAEDWVQTQLDLLGEAHVGYGKLDLPTLGLTVVGGRPFSWGGPEWRTKTFYRERFGVDNFEASVTRIKEAIDAAAHNTILFIGHCGPTGLGAHPEAICGKDWQPIGGDYGDPDLTEAIAYARQIGKAVPLVTFGHM